MNFPHLAQRLFNRPVAILPDKAEIIMASLAERMGITHLFRGDGSGASLNISDYYGDDTESTARRGYDLVAGVAVIPILGTLVQKLGTLRPVSGMTGYDGIRENFLTAMADPDVEAVVLDIDSPGGEVSGCFDLADLIFEMRGKKKIHAILNESAYSAAYAIASAAHRITVPRTGGTGSIGVICLHVDLSQSLDKAGIKVTIIKYGAHKADGQPYHPISDEALAGFQADIDTMGDLFVATVARNRNLAAEKVRSMEAATFLGGKGVAQGLADAVMAPDAAFYALLEDLG